MPARPAAGDGDEGRFGFGSGHVARAAKGLSAASLTVSRAFSRTLRMARDAEKNPDTGQHRQEIRAAVADERQRQALVRQRTGHDADVDGGLEADEKRDSHGQQTAERVTRMQRDVNAADDNDHERNDDQHRRNQTEFLPDDGKNKIGVMFRHEAEFPGARCRGRGRTSRRNRAQSWLDTPDNRHRFCSAPNPAS